MKKIIVIILSISVLVGLGFYAKSLLDKSGKSDTELISFAIKESETIDKVIISDTYGLKTTLIKKGNSWSDPKGNCINLQSIEFMLDAIKNIEFKGYVTDQEKKNFTKLMTTTHTKVEIFQKGELTKTWFIGPSYKDHQGQVMLLDSKEEGKSAHPVVMCMRTQNGIIKPRFSADLRDWICHDIFTVRTAEVKEVDLKFTNEPHRSFNIKRSGNNFQVSHDNKLLPEVDTANIYRYLQQYTDVNYNVANYTLNKKQVDSVKQSEPFCILTLKEIKGKVSVLRMFPLQFETETMENGQIEINNADESLFWCELPSGELVKCQYFHFDPLLKGHLYFPSMMKLEKAPE